MEYYIIDSVHVGSKEIFRVRAGKWRVCVLTGGSRGKVQGVRTPPPPNPKMMTCSFLIQLVFCQKRRLSGLLACENIHFSSLFAAGEVSRGGMSATQRQKFDTDDVN